jgi:CRP/FNR family transcriptional regulator
MTGPSCKGSDEGGALEVAMRYRVRGRCDTVADPMGQRDRPGREPITIGFLGTLPDATASELLADALEIDVPAGGEVYRAEEPPRVIVVRHGLLRLYHSAADGREVSIRYARAGDVLGLELMLGGPAPVTIQALTSTSVVALPISQLRRLFERDPAVARACAAELARQLVRAFDEIAEQAFFTVRQRVARRLLDLAEYRPNGTLVARATQQELADAVASTREVVARAIRDLRREGLVAASRKGIIVPDPVALREEAAGLGHEAAAQAAGP